MRVYARAGLPLRYGDHRKNPFVSGKRRRARIHTPRSFRQSPFVSASVSRRPSPGRRRHTARTAAAGGPEWQCECQIRSQPGPKPEHRRCPDETQRNADAATGPPTGSRDSDIVATAESCAIHNNATGGKEKTAGTACAPAVRLIRARCPGGISSGNARACMGPAVPRRCRRPARRTARSALRQAWRDADGQHARRDASAGHRPRCRTSRPW